MKYSIKYSILMPYYNRLEQFEKTLSSFVFQYSERKDIEIILVLDNKVTKNEAYKLFALIKKNPELNINVFGRATNSWNPCESFNIAASFAKGDYFVLTNPECYHITDVLSGADIEFERDKGVYVVCACKALKKDFTMHRWNQHSVLRNTGYHFCSVLHKDTYWSVNGFDERFSNGFAYDDDAFRDSLKNKGIQFVYRDDLVVYHLFHEKIRPKRYKEMLHLNKKIYQDNYVNAVNI